MENYGTGNKVQIFGAEIRSTREPNSRLLGVNISVTIAKIGINKMFSTYGKVHSVSDLRCAVDELFFC